MYTYVKEHTESSVIWFKLVILKKKNYVGKYSMISLTYGILKNPRTWGFPGGAVVKNPPANAGDTGSSPGPGRSHMLRSN